MVNANSNYYLEKAVNQIRRDVPEFAELFSGGPRLRFPGGLRWRFLRLDVGRRYYMYAWSTVRNENGKFLSWVYRPYYTLAPRRLAFRMERIRETRLLRSAKARSYRMFESHKNRLELANAQTRERIGD